MATLGLIVVGDFALATGCDQHVKFVTSMLGRAGQSLAWAWFIPADRVQLASALHEAWQRPHVVACFGGLGNGVDDSVRLTIKALQTGREQVGLSCHAQSESDGVLTCANTTFFPGHPEQSHAAFERWWLSQPFDADAPATERVLWALPESTHAVDARRKVKAGYPTVTQRLTAAGDGDVMLTFTGPSKGKVQGARKALQRALTVTG